MVRTNPIMKIAFLAYDRPGYHGGPIVNALRLLPELHRRGHAVHALIMYRHGGSPSADALATQGVHVHTHEFPVWTEDGMDWLLQTLQKINPDVFVPNLSVPGWFASRWVRAAGVPTVAAYRSDDAFHAAMVETFVLGEPQWAVSGLVCVNRAACDRLSAARPERTRLCVIPSGVPVSEVAANQHAPDGLRLVYVGRLVKEQKRILDVVDALANALKVLPDATATLVGHGGNRTDEQAVDCRIRELGMDHRIRRIGIVEPDRLHELLVSFQLLVLLSDYEGTPGSVMDGMACGLVPVCLDIPGGVRELVRHEETGLLVKDRGASFVEAILRLAGDVQLRQRLATAAREHVRQGYSLSVAADRWEGFFTDLLAEAGLRSPIDLPRRYHLPPVTAGLAREDPRRPGVLHQVFHAGRKKINQWLKEDDVDPMALFIHPRLAPRNLDKYHVRRSIAEAMQALRPLLSGTLLDIGCGQMPYKSLLTGPPSQVVRYIGLDFEDNPNYDNRPDIVWQDGRIPLGADSVDCAICTEVLEHCREPEAVLTEIHRVLKSEGLLFFTVPFLWPLHDVPCDEYRYTPFSLRRHLAASGFGDIEIKAMGGWDASLAQMLGLWVRRRPMKGWARALLSYATILPIRWLISSDRRKNSDFNRSTMITGLSGTAVKHAKRTCL
jgi:glycosyltransferase involved in cell wall biosynthesis/SAM-dependent methyltransferase